MRASGLSNGRIEKRTFAATRRTDDADKLASANFESKILDGGNRLAGFRSESECEVLCLDERCHDMPVAAI